MLISYVARIGNILWFFIVSCYGLHFYRIFKRKYGKYGSVFKLQEPPRESCSSLFPKKMYRLFSDNFYINSFYTRRKKQLSTPTYKRPRVYIIKNLIFD